MAVLKEIAIILRNIGNLDCLEKAKTLEVDTSKISTLNLRSLGLKSSDAAAIAAVIKREKGKNDDIIKSISFSYNPLIGDLGTTALIKSLPSSIR